MDARATWKHGLSFEGWAKSGFTLPMGTTPEVGGDTDGFKPIELMLVGLAGCTGMDVISILQKKRQDVTAFEVRVDGQRAPDHPRYYTHIKVEFHVTGHNIDRTAVERAVELSATRYCSVQAMLGKAAEIEHVIVIEEA